MYDVVVSSVYMLILKVWFILYILSLTIIYFFKVIPIQLVHFLGLLVNWVVDPQKKQTFLFSILCLQ